MTVGYSSDSKEALHPHMMRANSMPACHQEGPCVYQPILEEPIKASFVSTFTQNRAYTCAAHHA